MLSPALKIFIFVYHLNENQHGNVTCTITTTENPTGDSQSTTFDI